MASRTVGIAGALCSKTAASPTGGGARCYLPRERCIRSYDFSFSRQNSSISSVSSSMSWTRLTVHGFVFQPLTEPERRHADDGNDDEHEHVHVRDRPRPRDVAYDGHSILPLGVSRRRASTESNRLPTRNSKCKMQDAKCKMQDARCKMEDARCKMQITSTGR